MNEKYLSVGQAAVQTSLSRRFLYRLCKEKRLRHFIINQGKKRPGRILLAQEDIEGFIKSGEVVPGEKK